MAEDETPTTWTPKRGRFFQFVVWAIIGLISAAVIGGLIIILTG